MFQKLVSDDLIIPKKVSLVALMLFQTVMCRTMEEVEQSEYVSKLKAEFDSCDTTATGFLDREELTVLCQKLQLDAHLPLLLDTLLGRCAYGRVRAVTVCTCLQKQYIRLWN